MHKNTTSRKNTFIEKYFILTESSNKNVYLLNIYFSVDSKNCYG